MKARRRRQQRPPRCRCCCCRCCCCCCCCCCCLASSIRNWFGKTNFHENLNQFDSALSTHDSQGSGRFSSYTPIFMNISLIEFICMIKKEVCTTDQIFCQKKGTESIHKKKLKKLNIRSHFGACRVSRCAPLSIFLFIFVFLCIFCLNTNNLCKVFKLKLELEK